MRISFALNEDGKIPDQYIEEIDHALGGFLIVAGHYDMLIICVFKFEDITYRKVF